MTRIYLAALLSMISTMAFAGGDGGFIMPAPVPGPALGVAGPWGLAVGVAGYGAYKLYRHFSDR